MIKGIIDSITEALKERTKSPIVGSILFSWFIINHEIVIKAISKEVKHNEFILFIQSCPLSKLLWYPLLFGFLFVACSPFIDNVIQTIRRKAFLWGKEAKIKFDTEVATYRLKLIEQEAKNEEVKNQIEEKIIAL